MQYKHEYGEELENLIHDIAKDRKFLREFLFDLLSPAEYKDLAVRWQIVKMLEDGITQRDIAEKLKVSVATVNRGAREMLNKKGGFKVAIQKYYKKDPA